MTLVASQRSTTSSRTPGRVNEGTVYHERVTIIPCPDGCSAWMLETIPAGHHAPHWLDGRVVNCRNQPIPGWP